MTPLSPSSAASGHTCTDNSQSSTIPLKKNLVAARSSARGGRERRLVCVPQHQQSILFVQLSFSVSAARFLLGYRLLLFFMARFMTCPSTMLPPDASTTALILSRTLNRLGLRAPPSALSALCSDVCNSSCSRLRSPPMEALLVRRLVLASRSSSTNLRSDSTILCNASSAHQKPLEHVRRTTVDSYRYCSSIRFMALPVRLATSVV